MSTGRQGRGRGLPRGAAVQDRAWRDHRRTDPVRQAGSDGADGRKCRVALDLARIGGHSPGVPRPPRTSLRRLARRRLLAELAARAVTPHRALAPWLERARAAGVPARALAELGLMLHLYAGFPSSIEFLRALREAEPARARARRGPVGASHGASSMHARGVRLCARVYGPEYARLRGFMRALSPDLDRWMIDGGYGRVLSRPGLGVVERELCTVAALAALGWERQLDAHRRGAERVGASRAEVRGAERRGRALGRAGA